MKKTLFLTSFCLLFTCSLAFSQGIRFDSTNWASIVSRAKVEKKMIFVDFYTTWCGPCKRLEREVFSLPEVGSKFNSSFINARIDAEKGEGIELAARFGVSAYPSSVFIKADDETIVYKTVGFLPVAKYLAETDAALDAFVKDPFAALEFEYQKGNRTTELLTKMITDKVRLNRPIDRELEAFFTTHWVDSFFVKENERLFRDLKMDVNGRAFDILMQRVAQINQSSFYTLQPSVKQMIDRNLLTAVKNARKTKDEATLTRVVNYAESMWSYKKLKNSEVSRYQMVFYQHGGDPDKLVKVTTEYMTQGSLMNVTTIAQRGFSDAMMKNAKEKMAGKVSERMTMDSAQIDKAEKNILASSQSGMNLYYAKEFVGILQPYLDFVTDPKAFRLAQEWSKRLVELDGTADNLSIHAQIVFKAGDKKEAITVQKGAIEKAKQEKYSVKDLAVLTGVLNKMTE